VYGIAIISFNIAERLNVKKALHVLSIKVCFNLKRKSIWNLEEELFLNYFVLKMCFVDIFEKDCRINLTLKYISLPSCSALRKIF